MKTNVPILSGPVTGPAARPTPVCLPGRVPLRLALGVLAAASARADSAVDFSALRELGLDYSLREQQAPVPNRIHVLRVNWTSGRVRPVVAVAPDPDGDGPAEAALTDPRQLARQAEIVAGVNANPWDSFPDANGRRNRHWHEGQAVDIQGLAVSGGRVHSPAEAAFPALWLEAAGRWQMGTTPEEARPLEGVAGFGLVLQNGQSVVSPGGPRHPRTAVGMDRTGQTLWLVVVDGRQRGFSEGMTLEELSRVLLELGCWVAINLDGGGSSVMLLQDSKGRLQIVNRPSDRGLGLAPQVRPVPALLGLRRTGPSEGAKP